MRSCWRRRLTHEQPDQSTRVPPQPNQEYYGTGVVALLKTFTRDTYLTAFGVQAPVYDPSRLIKTWFDSTVDTSDPSNVAVYKIVGQDPTGNWTLRQMVIPAQEAATISPPGQSFIRPIS